MKNMKRILALLIAVLMIATMVPAFAAETTDGSITIHSPIMGAEYTGYKVFDMTMNAAGDSFSYTIAKSNPFYNAVAAYAATESNGLALTATNSDPDTFNVYATEPAFKAQDFGKYLEDKIASGDIVNPTTYTPTYEAGATAITVATAESVTFENLPLGYYLILSKYPKVGVTVTLGEGDDAQQFNLQDATDAEINAAVAQYVNSVVTDDYVNAYIAEHPMQGSGEDGAITDGDRAQVKEQLIASMTADAKEKVEKAIAENKDNPALSDLNVLTQRMVFIDTTTPKADIIEKNETHKWDVPVNPEGEADLKPHGEPEGGKNIIIVKDGKEYAVDWTEANVGDKVHYRLSINAVNFERVDGTVKQIKEYIIADYENKNMTFVQADKLMVRVVLKDANGNVPEGATPLYEADYTAWADKFFHNDGKVDLGNADVLGADKEGGLVIPWVKKTKVAPSDMTNVTTSYEFVRDGEGNKVPIYSLASEEFKAAHPDLVDEDGYVLDPDTHKRIQATDANGDPAYETELVYWESLYPNDATILVDYYMTLDDPATIDGEGNINISQYGVTFVKPDDYTWKPTEPTVQEDRKPEELKEKDDATVYTYALAIHKVDENGNDLAGAKFKIKGLTGAKKIADGWYRVETFNAEATTFEGAVELVTDTNGNLIIEGLMTSQEVEIQETEAPDGYNKLAGTVTTSPVKTGETITTKSLAKFFDEDKKLIKTVETETITSFKPEDGTKVTCIKVTTTEYVNGQAQTPAVTYTESTEPADTTELTLTSKLKAKEFKVVNNKGAELPSTGGMGTTLFYIGGGILVVLAIVMLVTKRRMSSND